MSTTGVLERVLFDNQHSHNDCIWWQDQQRAGRGTFCPHQHQWWECHYQSFCVSGTCQHCAGVSLDGVAVASNIERKNTAATSVVAAAETGTVTWVLWGSCGEGGPSDPRGCKSITSLNNKQNSNQGISFIQVSCQEIGVRGDSTYFSSRFLVIGWNEWFALINWTLKYVS